MKETGEQLRICPEKQSDEDRRHMREVGFSTLPNGDPDPAFPARARQFKPKSQAELACPENCPGAQTESRTILGVIKLPSLFDVKVCPLKGNQQ